MRVVLVTNVFWVMGFMGELALVAVLFYKGRWRQFPAFTTLIAFDALMTLAIYLVNTYADRSWYARVYWSYVVINFILQLAVVYELARVVLRPTGTWVRDARKEFILMGAGGAIVAGLLAYLVAPPASKAIYSLEVQSSLFCSLLICELFIAMTIASNRLGLFWRNHVMAIGQGLTIWSTMAVVVDSIHSYLGATRLYESLDYARSFTYLCALAYWCIRLWREEPARQPISPELRNYIVALHRRVQYDLGEAEQ